MAWGAGTIPKWAWGYTIDASNKSLVVRTDGHDETLALAEGTYYWRADDSDDDLCAILKTALNTNGYGGVYSVTLTSAGKLSIQCTKAFQLRWADGATTLPKADFGFYGNTSSSGVSPPYTMVGYTQVSNVWLPEQVYVRDTEEYPEVSRSVAHTLSGRMRAAVHATRYLRDVEVDLLPAKKIFTAQEASTHEAYERLYTVLQAGEPVEFARDWTNNPDAYGTYVVPEPEWATIPTQLVSLYTIKMRMRKYVG